MTVKVSVVVAVFNAGSHIDELLASLDAQTLPPEEFEVLLCDDDSTDGTRERLGEWVAERPHARLIHNHPNSGWPSRPRNLGIDAARGEFLFFADDDDRLVPGSLSWMYDFASENSSDIVIPKLVGVGRGALPRALFRHNIVDAKLGKDPILTILTPHKLFRTAMIREHGIRFPEGEVRRLEDHYFVVSAYFAAKRISVYADQVCYYWVRWVDGDHVSSYPVTHTEYYDSVIRVLEVVERNTEPGPLRDRLYAHWYNGKMLARLAGRSLLHRSVADQERRVAELRRVSQRFGLGEAQHPWLSAPARVRSHLLQHGDLDQIRAFAEAEVGVRMTHRLTEIAWADDRLRLTVTASLTYKDGRPVRVRHIGGRVVWRVEDILPDVDLPEVDVTREFPLSRVDVLARDRGSMSATFLPRQSVPPPADEATVESTVVFDPAEVFANTPTGSVSDLLVRLSACGWMVEERLSAGAFTATLPALGSRRLGDDWVWPYAARNSHALSVRTAATPPVQGKVPAYLRRIVARVPVLTHPRLEPLRRAARAMLSVRNQKHDRTGRSAPR
jgi:glycosyltransferase involved in cell wall biosynthesis